MSLWLTEWNHFKFGYNGKENTRRQSVKDQWFAVYGRCKRSPKNFYHECLITARRIAEIANQPIWVLMSGGIDSEVVAQSFYLAEIPFNVAICRYRGGLNEHDYIYAVQFCEKYGVPYQFYDLDILRFWNSEGLQYAIDSQCISPQLIAVMWLMDQVPGYPVLGSGECLLEKKQNSCEWELWEKEKVASWYRHLQLRGRPGCPGFFQFTPEIMLSYLLDPDVQAMKANLDPRIVSSTQIKQGLYKKYFDLEDRPKFTGFERVIHEDLIFRSYLKSLMPDSDQVYKVSYCTLVHMLLPKIFVETSVL